MKEESIHKDHRKRMKDTYINNGFQAFSDVEKLEFILYFALPRVDTNPIAHRLLRAFGSFDKVLEAPIERLSMIDGMSEHSSILLSLFLKVASTYGYSKCDDVITGTDSAKLYCSNLFKGKHIEEFYLICLTASNHVINCKLINSGTASEVPVDIRTITNHILSNSCERVIITHNHPQGTARPSDEDVAFTTKIVFSCILNNIEVLDHIIVNNQIEYSFEEANILTELKKDALRRMPFDRKTINRFGQPSTNYTNDKKSV